MDKREARALVKARLAAAAPEQLATADRRVAEAFLALPEYASAGTVFCYVSFDQELDSGPILRQVLAEGKRLAVPLIVGPGLMEARLISSLDQLRPGAYGILAPGPETPPVAKAALELIVTPGLAFDQDRWRLGRGGGFYDRWLADFAGLSVGLTREMQMLDGLPHEPWDCRVQILLTEQRVIRG